MDAVLTVMVEEKIGPGEQALRLIQIAKENLGFDFCLSLRSPAIALAAALKLLQLERGSVAAVSALSPIYYIKVLEDLGLKPLFCDCGDSSPCISAETVKAAIERTEDKQSVRCIIVHHSLGYMSDMDALLELGLPVIEDCSTAAGSSFGEKKSGSFGTFTVLGLEERDMLTAGGGALLYAKERRNGTVLRNAGTLPPEYGLADMNAAMAIVQFREVQKNIEKRKEYAELYLRSALMQGRHKVFYKPDNFEYNNYAFPLILETGMKDVAAYAKRKEIAVENAFDGTAAAAGIVPQTECPAACSLCLRTALFPIYPRLGGANLKKIALLIQTLP
ncbi:aminotransferase [Spirochaetia bacterium]|nr:aminotransferase [Spirochaetia bacterium]